jgi:Low affinity iron permease
MNSRADQVLPSQVSDRLGLFDRFAGWASRLASRATFFCFCVLLVVVWAPSYFLLRSVDTWQLIINTATTIITFLLVALLQNSQERSDEALHQKLNAIADGVADLMQVVARDRPEMLQDRNELLQAVGLENRESA